jgi:creatinine amidohydrolase
MQWEELTSPEFAVAAEQTDVCVIAMGVIERHSEHLPLGTDYLIGHHIACLAAEKEPAVVFPPFYFGQIFEARCFPGTVTIPPRLLFELVQSVFDEIGRNGFEKIIAYNAHGGSWALLQLLAQCSLWEEKPYTLYIPLTHLTPEGEQEWDKIRDSAFDGHAGETETSLVLAAYPELVHTESIPSTPGTPLQRLSHLPQTFTGIGWYANHPEHYAGDASVASAEKGDRLISLSVDCLAQYIAAVRADEVAHSLTREFFERASQIGGH